MTKYAKNIPNVSLENDKTSDFEFKVQAFFSGPIVYFEDSIESVSLYGGNAWWRNNKSMWPGQFAREGKTGGNNINTQGIGAGQYLVADNSSCGPITGQPQCSYSSTNAITTNPNLTKNTCCTPYFDINENVTEKGKEVIFNSYYGFCFSGYYNNWDFCTNKQIWISATPDYLSTTKLGSVGYADPSDTLYGKTMIAQSTNTKDISYFSGSGVKGGDADDWCYGDNCAVPTNNTPAYVNFPQNKASSFPKIINSDTTNWSAPLLGVKSNTKWGCPVDCPSPCGFVRWGQNIKKGKTASTESCPRSGAVNPVPIDDPDDWEIINPGDGIPSVSWMPTINQREISYYPLKKDTSDPNKTIQILGSNYDFNSLKGTSSYANATDLALWMGSVASSTSLSTNSRQYVAYGCIIHGAVCAIYNDWYSDDPASGLTILNDVSDFINLYFTHPNVQGSNANSLKSQLLGTTLNGLDIWTKIIGNDKEPVTLFFKPNDTLISNLIKAPEISLVNGNYQITFSQSIWQFLESSEYNPIIDLFWIGENNTNYNTLISILNNYLNATIKSFFGSNQGNESMTFNGKTVNNTQDMELEIIGSNMSNIQMSFNCWDMVNGQQQASPVLAYDFINPNGALKGIVGLYTSSSLYHAISINYTATIKQFSPMSVLYYSYKASGKGAPNLQLSDPMCKYDFNNPTIAPPISCMNAYVAATGTPRTLLLDVCNGGIGSGRGYGGFQYQPPIKKITSPTLPTWNPSMFNPVEIQVTVAGDGSIANYLFSQNQGQSVPACTCIQTRLKTDILSGDPTGGMCFSTTCAQDTSTLNTLGLDNTTCKSYCTEMCGLLQGFKINNVEDFDSTQFRNVCGYQCSGYTFNPSASNSDVVLS